MTDEQAQRVIKAIVEEHAGTVELEPRYLTDEEDGTRSGRILARIDVLGASLYAVGEEPGIAGAIAAAEQQLRTLLAIFTEVEL
jgi:hypothetical protein